MSKIVPKFKGEVKDGKLFFDKRQLFDLFLENLEGKRVEVIVQKEKKSRSNNQNALYWAYLSVISDETGEDSERLHEFFKLTLLPTKTIKVFGKEVIIPGSTAELSTIEFMDYMNRIESLTGLPCPDPNDYYSIR